MSRRALVSLLCIGFVATAIVVVSRTQWWNPREDEVGDLMDAIEAGARPSGWIVAAEVALREEPSDRAPVRAILHKGTALVVRREESGWTRVRGYEDGNLEGWVPSSAVGTAPEANPETPAGRRPRS